MLKKDMQELIAALEDQLLDYENNARVDKELIKSAADKERKHTKLKRHVDKAKSSIDALIKVNCYNEDQWSFEGRHSFEHLVREGKEVPEAPESTDLYRALVLIKEILNRPIEETANDSPFDRY